MQENEIDAEWEPEEGSKLRCPKCGSTNVDVQVHQENRGGKTITKTKTVYKEKKHGCLWWLVFGWWWWIVDFFIWIFFFPFRFAYGLLRKKKYASKGTTTSTTKNNIKYKTIRVCKSCGYTWQ